MLVPHRSPRIDAATLPRWLWYLAVFVLVGSVVFRQVARRALAHAELAEADVLGGISRRARRLAVTAAAALLVLAFVRLYVQVRSFLEPGEPLDADLARSMVFATTWGTGWMVQLGATAVALAGTVLAGGRFRAGWGPAALGAATVALTTPLTGHAMSGPWSPLVMVPLQAAHFLAGATWLGTLFAMLVVGVVAARQLPDDRRGGAVAAMVHTFSPLALVGAATAVLAGGVLAYAYIGSLPVLWRTDYGRALLIKLALLLAVAGMGAWNWRRVRPTLGQTARIGRLQRSATAELVFGAMLLAVTAILVALPSPHP